MYQMDSTTKAEVYQDVLNEIGNIGAGNAATALSQMMNTVIRISVTQVKFATPQEASDYIDPDRTPMSGAILDIVGDIRGKMMFLLSSEHADRLVSTLMCGMDVSMIPQEMKDSALQEVGNIITASYINSLSVLTGLTIDESVPTIINGSFDDIMSHIDTQSSKLLLVQTKMIAEQATVTGYCVFVPEPYSFSLLLKTLGIA